MNIVRSVHIRCAGAALLLSASVAAAPTLEVTKPGAPPAALLAAVAPAARGAVAQAWSEARQADALASRPVACDGRHPHGVRYHVQRLQAFEGARSSFPRAVNNLGIVVGYSSVGGLGRPTVWIGRRGFELATLGGRYGVAEDINDAGVIVGIGTTADSASRGMSWFLGARRNLGTLDGADTASHAYGVNNLGKIVGIGMLPDRSASRAVAWRGGAPRQATLGGSSTAYGVNDFGYSVGSSRTAGPDSQEHAALWRPDGSVQDLGTLGGRLSIAYSINNKGKAVGYAYRLGETRLTAALWEQGAASELPGLGGRTSVANDINNRDQAVGFATTADEVDRGIIWFGKTPVQLDTLLDDESQGLQISRAEAINDRGQIAAQRNIDVVTIEPLLLTPRPCRYE
ncbi:hypothetical protein [Massilia sp. YIM B02443]|uniref:hypothetical protein n=1 Tax=Massilia sp. YIM B02443 TaxID=3050127 RepID=UPI0025B716F8|nr:hypothetical protein [Massilia sp. YIM B02443]MDN4038546.1 hypothetical protein [Massilia sp. YIM B02443]